MNQKDRAQLGDSLHARTQRVRVASDEFVDAARAHERLEANNAALDQRLKLVEVARHQPAPQSEVNLRRALHRLELQVERRDVRRHWEVVERHVDEGRISPSCECRRPVLDVLPLGPARFVEMDVRIDTAGKHMQAGRVDLFAVSGKVRSDRNDLVAGGRDIGLLDSAGRHDRAAANDHSFANRSRNPLSTSIATATSSVFTDSAGLWLMPPLQRTKSIPTSVRADMATASCPAPLASSTSGCPRSRTACARLQTRRCEHGTVASSLIWLVLSPIPRCFAISAAMSRRRREATRRRASSACRTSRLRVTSPGTTLAAPGRTSSCPTVATSPSWLPA